MKDLHALTDELNFALIDFEQAVIDIGWGCPAEVPMGDGDEVIRFGKLNGKWQLQYIRDDEFQPLTNAPRDRRVAAVEVMPQLLIALAKAYEASRLGVSEATEKLTNLTGELRSKGKIL